MFATSLVFPVALISLNENSPLRAVGVLVSMQGCAKVHFPFMLFEGISFLFYALLKFCEFCLWLCFFYSWL